MGIIFRAQEKDGFEGFNKFCITMNNYIKENYKIRAIYEFKSGHYIYITNNNSDSVDSTLYNKNKGFIGTIPNINIKKIESVINDMLSEKNEKQRIRIFVEAIIDKEYSMMAEEF